MIMIKYDNPESRKMIEHFYPAGTKIVQSCGTSIHNHTATLRLTCKNKDEFLNWLKEHQLLSGVTFRVQSSNNNNGKTVQYKAIYRCQHNTLPVPWQHGTKNPSKKHTDCETRLSVTIKTSPSDRRVRTKDDLRFTFPTILTINHQHNHLISGAEGVKYKDPGEDVKTRFIDLFKSHHPPARALYLYKQDLLEEYEDEFFKVAADRSVCPDLQWVYRLYYSKFKEEFGNEREDLGKTLEDLQKSYGEQDVNMKYEILSNDYIVALCTPLMKRVHSLDLAGHIVFIDSSGNMDRYNSKIFLLMTDSQVGGLPLGIFISTSESEIAITKGLQLLNNILPEKSFGGNGSRGPAVFMSDDSTAQQNALSNVFPATKIWLCTFHVLQSAWRWLMDKKHGIDDHDRQDLYRLFKEILISKTDDALSRTTSALHESSVACKYPLFRAYVEKMCEYTEKWTHVYRTSSRGNHTNNIVERAMGVLKDKVLCRTRAFNLTQLLSFLCFTLPDFYKQKIFDIVSGRYQSVAQTRYVVKEGKLKSLKIVTGDSSFFTVKNMDTGHSYGVNMDIGVCTCEIGRNGAPCKHQHFVAVTCNVSSGNIVPTTEKEKCFFHFVATGSNQVPMDWYAPLTTKVCVDLPSTTPSLTCELPEEDSPSNVKPAGIIMKDTGEVNFSLEVEKQVEEISDLLILRAQTNPILFSKALSSFHSAFKDMKTESSMLSALHQFGKPTHLPLTCKKYRTTIPVQPTAVARRKFTVKGRRCIQSGRPAKVNFTSEHGYSKKKNSRPGKAPHSLQESVDRNYSSSKKTLGLDLTFFWGFVDVVRYSTLHVSIPVGLIV